jgi:hypothetical protein
MAIWAERNGTQLRMTATDYAPQALTDSQRLARELKVDLSTEIVDLERPIEPQLMDHHGYDLVLAMNVFNELTPPALEALPSALGKLLKPTGYLVAIEPASMGPSRKVLALRDAFVGAGWGLRLPCTHALPCPALMDENQWCHDTWSFSRPDFMARVDQQVGTRREVLKATWFVVEPNGIETARDPSTGQEARAVSELFLEKGRARIHACTDGELVTLELQRRDRRSTNEALMQASRYSLLTFEGAHLVGDALRLGPDALCKEITEPDESVD